MEGCSLHFPHEISNIPNLRVHEQFNAARFRNCLEEREPLAALNAAQRSDERVKS